MKVGKIKTFLEWLKSNNKAGSVKTDPAKMKPGGGWKK